MLERTPTLLARLVQRCSDPDSSTRKFACFAVGNAAFHSSVLYVHLHSSIPQLMEATKDKDEKTRANAAGALGNLVRNSSELCAPLMSSGAAQRLLEVAVSDEAAAPKRIALFSLGTLAVYSLCRPGLDGLSPALLDALADIEREAKSSASPDQQVGTRTWAPHVARKANKSWLNLQVLDHVARIRKKLCQVGL